MNIICVYKCIPRKTEKTRNTRKNTYQTGGDSPDGNSVVRWGLSGTFIIARMLGLVLAISKNGAHVNPNFL